MKKMTDKQVSAYLAKPEIAKMFDGYEGDFTTPEDVMFYEMHRDGVQPEDVGAYELYDPEEYPPGGLARYKSYLVENPITEVK